MVPVPKILSKRCQSLFSEEQGRLLVKRALDGKGRFGVAPEKMRGVGEFHLAERLGFSLRRLAFL
jgi:hypothetical protein